MIILKSLGGRKLIGLNKLAKNYLRSSMYEGGEHSSMYEGGEHSSMYGGVGHKYVNSFISNIEYKEGPSWW